jgi:hypothetical protein
MKKSYLDRNSTINEKIIRPFTQTERRIYDYLVNYQGIKGYPPTIREM